MLSFGRGKVLLTVSESISNSIFDGYKYQRCLAGRGEDASELWPSAIARNDPKFREDMELVGSLDFAP